MTHQTENRAERTDKIKKRFHYLVDQITNPKGVRFDVCAEERFAHDNKRKVHHLLRHADRGAVSPPTTKPHRSIDHDIRVVLQVLMLEYRLNDPSLASMRFPFACQ